MITTTRSIPDRRTALRHIHPALTIEQQFSPFALVVAWDGLELGTVHDYLAAEQLGRDWLQHLLEQDACDATDIVLATCPKTGWTVHAARRDREWQAWGCLVHVSVLRLGRESQDQPAL
jgi:hypothetical protein